MEPNEQLDPCFELLDQIAELTGDLKHAAMAVERCTEDLNRAKADLYNVEQRLINQRDTLKRNLCRIQLNGLVGAKESEVVK